VRERVLILHGWGGSDHPHWQAFLACRLAREYGTLSFPLIQHPHYPSLGRWKREVTPLLRDFAPDTVVCHSLANTLWLHLCEEGVLHKPVSRLFMVSPPSLHTEHETIATFFPTPLPESIYADYSMLIVSDNDPWIAVEEARDLAYRYSSDFKIIPGAGHINEESGYGEWRWLEDMVLRADASKESIEREVD
jgi:predicted alpha/beta hydrolase family esterase